jgi:hypothetical protein
MTGAFAGSTVLRRESQTLCSHFSKTKEWLRFASHPKSATFRAFTRLGAAQRATGLTAFSITFFVASAGSRELATAVLFTVCNETDVAAIKSKLVAK